MLCLLSRRSAGACFTKQWFCELALLLTITSAFYGSQRVRAEGDDEKTYGVILDCGSSGTRAHIYYWDTKLDYPELLHKIEPLRDKITNKEISKKFQPSLAKLVDMKPAQREEHFAILMDYVASNIPRSRHAFTVIYMMATAGMRLLDKSDQDTITDQARSYIYAHYDFRDVRVDVISGADEGMYRWISVNAKAKRFLGKKTNGRTKTYAVIEMGGASVQVVYQLQPGLSQLFEERLKVRKGDKLARIYKEQIVEPRISREDKPENTYRLHSTTFLGFGGDSAYQAYLDLLISKQHNKAVIWRLLHNSMTKAQHWLSNVFDRMVFPCRAGFNCSRAGHSAAGQRQRNHHHAQGGTHVVTIKDPCSPKGFHSVEHKIEIKKPTRMLDNKEQTLGFIVDDDDEKDDKVFGLCVIGTGNYHQCKKYVEEMLYLAKKERLNCKKGDYCTMELLGHNFIPWDTTDFVGIGDFYHTTNTMLGLAGFYNHNEIAEKTKTICNTPEKQLEKQYPSVKHSNFSERIYTECFRAVWMDTFLVRGLRMDPGFDMLKTVDKINEQEAEWTLGAVMDQSLAIEEATVIPPEVSDGILV